MLKFLAKIAEKYAKSTNTACTLFFIFHQPKNACKFNKKRLKVIGKNSSTIYFYQC